MTDETTTEQLAEIEGQATGYTPPEGWRVLRYGEVLQPGDVWVNWEGTESRPDILHGDGATVSGGRYIRRIEPQPQPEPAEYTPPEGWRVLAVGEVLRDSDVWVNHEGESRPTKRVGERVNDERYIRRIEPQSKPQPEPQAAAIEELRSEVSYVQRLLGESRQRVTQLEGLVASLRTINEAQEKAVEAAGKENTALRIQVQNRQQEYEWQKGRIAFLETLNAYALQQQIERQKGRIEFLETLDAGNAVAIVDYRAKVEKLQGLVDTARGQLETAATEHDSLRLQLAAVKAELVTQAETSRRLQIELDAAQQVPADSPEIRQLRADLEQMTLGRDTYRDGYERVLSDLETIRETAKAEAVEAIAEWLQAFRGCNSPALALLLLEALPSIMRSLTGLADEEIE